MFGLFKKKLLPKKVLLLSALPDDKETFFMYAENGKSDFLHSLQDFYRTDDLGCLWGKYRFSANALCSTYKKIESRGGRVVRNFTLQDLKMVNQYDVIVVIAHHSDNSDEIEIGGKLIRSIDFVNVIPKNTSSVLDLTSCYSANLIPKIKAHIPYSKIIGIEVKTNLSLRLFILNKIIKHWSENPSLDYVNVLQEIMSRLPNTSGGHHLKKDNSTIYLGGKLQSTVFAPAEAISGEDFIVSVFLHKSEEMDEVIICSRNIDEKAEIRGTKHLSLKIKKGDKLDFQLSLSKQLSSLFGIDKKTKGFLWDEDINNVEFIVSVSENCTVSSFIGKINIYVNKEPAGDIVFKTKIVRPESICYDKCADFEFVPFNKMAEMNDAKIALKETLSRKIAILDKQICQGEPRELVDELEMCRKCEELLDGFQKKRNDVLKVFISSTSDMKQFRQVVRDRVEACEMYPDMYENWGQGNDYPRDLCCQHVLQSDIFVCILGAKYGFIEPIWDKSMTEIEYRVALNAGIPVLIYIIANYKEEMDKLVDEEKTKAIRQEKLIEEIKRKRLVGLFPNELGLSLLVNSELQTVKHSIQS